MFIVKNIFLTRDQLHDEIMMRGAVVINSNTAKIKVI